MSDLESNPSLKLIRTFGRLKGRALSKNQMLGMEMLKEKFGFSFNTKKKIWLEVGFGNGKHLVELAKRNTDKLILGSEVYENGVAATCYSLIKNKIENAKVFHGDVRILLASLKHKSIDRLYILFPDPWTKKRHKSRRLLSLENLKLFSKVINSEGYVCIATDVEDYCLEIDNAFSNLHEFKTLNASPKDKNLSFFLDVKTKYEDKAINKGISPFYLVYKKF